MKTTALLLVALLAIIALAASENAKPNAGLPAVKAAVPMFPAAPTWRLYTTCPLDRRNVPIVQERSA